MQIKKTDGFGLIEILITIGIIAGLGFLVSDFVLNTSSKQIDVRQGSDCQAKLSAAISKIKESDNNLKIDNWLPKTNEMNPIDPVIANRIKEDIINEYDNDAMVGQILALANVIRINPASYSAAERQSAAEFNNYQLISSASSILSQVYPESCGAPMDATALPDGQLKDILQQELGGLGGVRIQVQKASGSSLTCDSNWQAVPINANPQANINNNDLVSLTLSADFQDETAGGVLKSCTANATFSPGSDLVAPTVQAVLTAGAGLTETDPGIFCGAPNSRGSFSVQISQPSPPELGVQYLCRLDYVRGNLATITDRNSGTGWFVCSMPEASIRAVVVGGPSPNLTVSNVDASTNNSVSFTIGNAAEGSYRLHVKAVDTARNESIIQRDIQIDLNRPSLLNTFAPPFPNSTTDNLGAYRFQCGPGRDHNAWLVQDGGTGRWIRPGDGTLLSQVTESIEVTSPIVRQRYVNFTSNALSYNANFSCSDTNNNLGPSAWPVDGPKIGQIVVCDACNQAAGDATRNLTNFLWFVDTTNNLTATAASLSGSRLQYDAGPNEGNPYILSHKLISTIGHPTSTISESNFAYNSYDINRNLTQAPVFPAQPIGMCHTYGTYSYSSTDGCGRTRAQANWNGIYTGPATGALGSNPLYCPSFENSAGAAINCDVGMIDCAVNTAGGYSGLRTGTLAGSNCSFYTNKHRACASPTCNGPLYLLTSGTSIHPYKCATCNGSTEVIVQPRELGGGPVASIANGCAGCDGPPCLNYARCYALRKCLTGVPAADAPRDVSSAGGGGTTACGIGFSYLVCAADPVDYHIRNLYLAQDPLPSPTDLFSDILSPLDSRINCACDNGATNYPTCNTCSVGYTYDGSSCVASTCPGGQINPPTCDQMPTCPGGQINPPTCDQMPTCPVGFSNPPSCTTPVAMCWSLSTTVNCYTSGSCTVMNETRTSGCESGGVAPPSSVITCRPTSEGLCVGPLEPPPPGGGGGGCFVAGSKVLLSNGMQASIEDIKLGDEVVSFDEKTQTLRSEEVVDVFHHEAKLQQLFTFEFADGSNFTSNDVHPIYVKNLDRYIWASEIYRKWVRKDRVLLQDLSGESVEIKFISVRYSIEPVFNLHVKGVADYSERYGIGGIGHNYYVEGILVHNLKCALCPPLDNL